jgi:hypothetical protein
MARMWQRLAAAVFFVSIILVFSQCKLLKGLKPTPGAPCMIGNNKFQCMDPVNAMLCQNGKWVNMPCRGPRGCSGAGAGQTCDDDLAQPGEACMMAVSGDNLACGTGKVDELTCVAGTWKITRTCKGPKKCTISGSVLSCDDSMGDVGDPCAVESGDDNYGCSTDKKIEVVCDAASSKFQPSNTCRGPKGCWIDNNRVYCDQNMARIGDKCRPVDNHSCSEDSTQELKCSPQFTWTKQHDCKHSGCKIKNSEVYCE